MIAVGDRVAYSVRWLRSVGEVTGDLPAARGAVTALVPLGRHPDATVLAEIDWGQPGIPTRVNVANLTTVARIGQDAALCDVPYPMARGRRR